VIVVVFIGGVVVARAVRTGESPDPETVGTP